MSSSKERHPPPRHRQEDADRHEWQRVAKRLTEVEHRLDSLTKGFADFDSDVEDVRSEIRSLRDEVDGRIALIVTMVDSLAGRKRNGGPHGAG